MVSIENLYYRSVSGAGGGGVFKEKIFLNHLFPHSLFLKRILPSPRNNILLERKTNNDVARIGEEVMNSEH